MKTFTNISQKLIVALSILMGALLIVTTNVKASTEREKSKKENTLNKSEYIEIEGEIREALDEEAIIIESFKDNSQNQIKVFGQNDELLYEVSVNENENAKDEKLQKLLFKSDFLMNHNNTLYYRLQG
ncbi:hypothetical protein QQ008_04245 [Fulvivirgaceae bacterium BMA10]|uniref:Uncharacterized protein n=1 Tax=Splendidivirga corallicola TaxID=3051826 RepID=A0ABT8KKH9_9BACT|nr:hypothetical protein [Fulvivirgaceae bacterium BMA10]